MSTWEAELEADVFDVIWQGEGKTVFPSQVIQEELDDPFSFPETGVFEIAQATPTSEELDFVCSRKSRREKAFGFSACGNRIAEQRDQVQSQRPLRVSRALSLPDPNPYINVHEREEALGLQTRNQCAEVLKHLETSQASLQSDIQRLSTEIGGRTGQVATKATEAKLSIRIPGPADAYREGFTVERKRFRVAGKHDATRGEKTPCDADFEGGPWLTAMKTLDVEEFDPARYTVLKSTASSIKTSAYQSHVPNLVAVIKEFTPNTYGDAFVSLKDPTGTVQGCVNHKVLCESEFGSDIAPGAVIILRKVAIFSPRSGARYLNITVNNVVQVFARDTRLPQEKINDPIQFDMWSQRSQGQERPVTAGPMLGSVPTKAQPFVAKFSAAAQLAGWDSTDDIEALLRDNADDFFL